MPQRIEELRAMSESELLQEGEATRRELLNLTFQKSTDVGKGTAYRRQARRKVAWVLTILSERAREKDRAAAPVQSAKGSP